MLRKLFSKFVQANFSLKSNISANFLGNAVMSLASIVFVPIYLRYIGIEAYGLVGFFASFQAILVVMDLGLSLTLTRELALRDGIQEKEQESRNLVRTLEIIYWGIALLLGLFSILFVPLLTNWVNPQELSAETVRTCFLIMSLMVVLQFPITFYSGGLLGLQKQVLAGFITIFFSFFRYFGALAVLHFVSSKPQAFFIWQAVSSGFQVFTLGIFLWATLPKGTETAIFQINLFKNIWKFTTGMGGIGVLSMILLQVDKIVLVKLLPLESFGYYSIATVAATALYRIIYPIFQAFFPKLSRLVGKTDKELLIQTYHQGCQVMAVIIFPIAIMFVFFSKEIMFLWQRSEEIANQTALLVSLLIIGYTLNGLINIPYALQLAYGWTKLYFYGLLIALVFSIPGSIFLSLKFGAIGAAIIVIIPYAAFIFLLIPLMHRQLLPDQMWKWYGQDVALPLVSVIILGFLARFLFINQTSQIGVIIQLSVIFGLIFLITCLVTPDTRNWIINNLWRKNLS